MEAAGSIGPVASAAGASESHNSQPNAAESLQAGGSVNWGQGQGGGPQSPRVPRSQISRAHPAHNAGGFGERTSAVLSALSADDETALSAAEAAGEHTSERQEARGGRAEAQGEVAAAGGASTVPRSASGPVAVPPQQQPANSLTAPAPRRHEMAGSPPACTSPVYRANSVVSHTAVPNHKAQQQQQQQQWRGGETPLSAPAPQNLGSSPNGSRGELSAAVPQPRVLRRTAGAFSTGLPPTSGHRPQQQQQQQQQYPAGPSRPSLSGNQMHIAAAASSLPSTLAVAVGHFSPAGIALPGMLTPQHGAVSAPPPTPQPPALNTPATAGTAAGLQPAQLSVVAAALLQAQLLQQQRLGQPAAVSQQGAAMPPPPAPQQGEPAGAAPAVLQAQASGVIGDGMCGFGSTTLPPLHQQQSGLQGAVPPAVSQTAAAPPPSQERVAQQAAAAGAASFGAAPSVQSPGASAIQGHPLPPPFFGSGAAAASAPLQPGGTVQHTAAALHAVLFGAFAARGPPASTAPLPAQQAAAQALSDMQGSAIAPAQQAAVLGGAVGGEELQHPLAGSGGGEGGGSGGPAAACQAGSPDPPPQQQQQQQQQAASVVLGGGGGSFEPLRPVTDPGQRGAAAEQEGQRWLHAGGSPEPQAAVIADLPTADVAAASHGGMGGGAATRPAAVPQEAAMLGGVSTCAGALEMGGEDEQEGDDAMEVQQAAAQEGQGATLPPAPHGAASVMATVMTDNGGGRSEGDTEMQQTASGPSWRRAAAAPSASRSRAEPAVATVRNTEAASGGHSAGGGGTAATQPSQHAQVAQGQGAGSLATVSAAGGELGAQGSVEMGQAAPPSQQGQPAQHASSLPAPAAVEGSAAHCQHHGSPPPAPAGNRPQGATSPLAAAAGAAASSPAPPPQPAGGLHTPLVQPAASASLSGQGDTTGQGEHSREGVMPQSSAAAAAAPHFSQQAQQAQLEAGAATWPSPAHASVWGRGQQGGSVPLTDARSRGQGAAATAAGGAAVNATGSGGDALAAGVAAEEGMGSPTGSTLAEAAGQRQQQLEEQQEQQQRGSEGTARGTIIQAGAAQSILTTAAAAAGEGEAMDEAEEALSPLQAAKVLLAHAPSSSRGEGVGGTAGGDGTAVPAGGTPHTGSVGALPFSELAAAATGASSGRAGRQQLGQQQEGNQQDQQQQEGQQPANGFHLAHASSGAGGLLGSSNGCLGSPIDLSTMAVDLAPADGTATAGAAAAGPQPSDSGQPSGLPPPGAVAAALAVLEQQQAAQNGGMFTPPPAAPELGDAYYVLRQQNGYATHANSAIGNGYMAQSSPDRELTSPSRLVTHDSTGAGSGSRQGGAKRRRTSAGPAGSTHQA